MRLPLKLHADSRCDAVSHIEVEVMRSRSAQLRLRYVVTGRIGGLRVPQVATTPGRADRLWEHTCFEVFLAPAPLVSYYEFNFAPSMQWAGYRFNSHRRGRTNITEVTAPEIAVQPSAERYQLEAAVELERVAGLPRDATWLLGLSVIIEETSGSLSYWALAHPVGKADFHHADCFARQLPAA
jgi:hypothetical protein